MVNEYPFEPENPFRPAADQTPRKSSGKKNKKTILFGVLGVLLVALVIGIIFMAKPSVEEPEKPDVNGLTVSAACEKVREAGWRVDEVKGSENWKEKSDCSDGERKVVRASYNTYDEKDFKVVLYFPNEPEETSEETSVEESTTENPPVEETSAEGGASGYEAIYDEYSARLEKECPNLTMEECAEISNEGVGKMAEYMYGASGTDGQYTTYDSWARKLMGVYIASAQYR